MRINKKGIFLEGIVFFLAVLIIAVIIFAILYYFPSTSKLDNLKKEIGKNLIVVGIMRTQIDYEARTMPLSELIAQYKGDDSDAKIIRDNINSVMQKMYKKNVCWKLTILPSVIKNEADDCVELSGYDAISVTLLLPDFNKDSFEITFETKK